MGALVLCKYCHIKQHHVQGYFFCSFFCFDPLDNLISSVSLTKVELTEVDCIKVHL